jgi:2-iminobutanoate/2-iminopropanoate deaminase
VVRDPRHPEGFVRPAVPLSAVVVSGDLVYTSGQVAFDAEGTLVRGGLEEQTTQVFENLSACLAAAGCTLDDVVKVNAYLTDLGQFDAFNRVYAERFSEPYPARTTVGVKLADGLLVEIEAVARVPGSSGT